MKSVLYRCVNLEKSLLYLQSGHSIPEGATLLFRAFLYIFVFLIPSLFSEVAGSSLGSFLYFYSKRMREVQWSPDIDELTRYSRLDKIWIKHDFQARYVIVVINYNSTLSFWNQKEQCPFVTFEHSYFEESCQKKCTRQSRKELLVALNSIKYAYFSKCYLERFASISTPEKWTTNVAQRKTHDVKRDFK